MKKWFVGVINLFLGAFVILLWLLQKHEGTAYNYNTKEKYITIILLSFTGITSFMLLRPRNKK